MKEKVQVRSPINIALCKYWGKKDEDNVLAYTDSISLTLDSFYTDVVIEKKKDGKLEFYLNDVLLTGDEREKMIKYMRAIEQDIEHMPIRISSKNTGPTAAGLASSSSAFSALSLALLTFFEKIYSFDELVELSRLGSGSACRSLLDGFVRWKKDGQIEKLVSAPKDLRVIVVLFSKKQKKISSREAMKIGVETSPYYDEYVKKNQVISNEMAPALKTFDFDKIGLLMEQSTALMHKVMETSSPKVSYPTKDSYRVMNLVNVYRGKGVTAYSTMDAGPNVKIFTKEKDVDFLMEALKREGYSSLEVLKPGGKARVIANE